MLVYGVQLWCKQGDLPIVDHLDAEWSRMTMSEEQRVKMNCMFGCATGSLHTLVESETKFWQQLIGGIVFLDAIVTKDDLYCDEGCIINHFQATEEEMKDADIKIWMCVECGKDRRKEAREDSPEKSEYNNIGLEVRRIYYGLAEIKHWHLAELAVRTFHMGVDKTILVKYCKGREREKILTIFRHHQDRRKHRLAERATSGAIM